MISIHSDLLAAGFASACFALFAFACLNTLESGEVESNFEIASSLARSFAELSMSSSREEMEKWLTKQEKMLTHQRVRFRLEVRDNTDRSIFIFGKERPSECSESWLYCVWSNSTFPRIYKVVCFVWRE